MSRFRRFLDSLVDKAKGKELMGKDPLGNEFYRYFEGTGVARVERREVKWFTEYMMYDPNQVHPQWRLWLRKLRDTPPSDEELAQIAAKQSAYQARVAAVEEAENQRRMRQAATSSQAAQGGARAPDMSQLLQQQQRQQQQQQGGPAGAPGKSGAAEPSGKGDTFQPGTWKPGQ